MGSKLRAAELVEEQLPDTGAFRWYCVAFILQKLALGPAVAVFLRICSEWEGGIVLLQFLTLKVAFPEW